MKIVRYVNGPVSDQGPALLGRPSVSPFQTQTKRSSNSSIATTLDANLRNRMRGSRCAKHSVASCLGNDRT